MAVVDAINSHRYPVGHSCGRAVTTTACLAVFGVRACVLLVLNKRRHVAQWTYVMIPLTLAEGSSSLALQGLDVNLIAPPCSWSC